MIMSASILPLYEMAGYYFLHLEPWLCWSSRTARELKGSVPYSGYDGTRSSDHHAGQTG